MALKLIALLFVGAVCAEEHNITFEGLENLVNNGIPLTKDQMVVLNFLSKTLEEDIPDTAEGSPNYRKAAIATYWPEVDGVPYIRYTFHDIFVNKIAVYLALQDWRDSTCIEFEEVSPFTTGPHIRFKHVSPWEPCSSTLGQGSVFGQYININIQCEIWRGKIVHEIGHAIGFFHEQQRRDRDTHVTILGENLSCSSQFSLKAEKRLDVPYDVYSVMHHSGYGFSINGKNTIVTNDPRYQTVIGQRVGLSHMDKLMANKMYGCLEKYLAKCWLLSDPCQNFGYIGKTCTCVCPPGTAGLFCEFVKHPYADTFLPPNTEIISEPKIISTVNYPNYFPSDSDFVKWIKAPTGKLVKLTFIDFDIYPPMLYKGVFKCWLDALEIRKTNMLQGDWFCGKSIASGQEFLSSGNEMVLYFRGNTYFKRGWSASVSFVDDPMVLPGPKCTLFYENGYDYYASPSYPNYYPNGLTCSYHYKPKTMGLMYLYTEGFYLGEGDSVTVYNAYEEPTSLKGWILPKPILIPSSSFHLLFSSDALKNWKGFKIRMEKKETGCHKILYAGFPGILSAPNYPNYHPYETYCEWHLIATPGKRIQLDFLHMGLGIANYLAINLSLEPFYSPLSVVKVSGYELPDPIVSKAHMVRIFMHGPCTSTGFKLMYREIL